MLGWKQPRCRRKLRNLLTTRYRTPLRPELDCDTGFDGWTLPRAAPGTGGMRAGRDRSMTIEATTYR